MWPYKSLLVVLAVVVAASLAFLYGTTSWAGKADLLRMRLEEAREPVRVGRFDERELTGLPAPVQRYFRTALTPGQPMILSARFRHRGEFNMGDAEPNWKPFRSRQFVVVRRPGFVWEARIAVWPGLQAHVHDAYVAGVGMLHASLLGLFNLIDVRGSPAMAHGELLRYLAEAPWYPTALLPSQGVRWEAIDDRSARARLSDGDVGVSLVFRFGDDGLIESSRADARERTVAGASVVLPWGGRYWNVTTRQGMRIPQDGEVAWWLADGSYPYWRGHLVEIDHELAP
jgi:hypothetical protein